MLLFGLFFYTNVFAQPELDATFASSGKTVIYFGGSGVPNDIITTPDDKILMTSGCSHINLLFVPFCTVRLNEDGTIDTTFDDGDSRTSPGSVMTSITGMAQYQGSSSALALQNDGKIIAVGSGTISGSNLYILVRYNSNGRLDTTFGATGIIIGGFNDQTYVSDVELLPDGKIVIVGTLGNQSRAQFVARFNTDGTIDNTFGVEGVAKLAVAGSSAYGTSIAIQPDGKIVTGGTFTNGTAPSYLFARYNRNGTLDSTFDEDGYKTIPIPGTTFNYYLQSIAVQTDGRILGLGSSSFIYRLNADGSLDTSFDGDGSRPALPNASDTEDLYVSPSGKITVVGMFSYPGGGPPYEYRVARYRADGSLDMSFSDDGYLNIDVGSSLIDGADLVTADSKGRIVIGGRSALGIIGNPWENSIFSAARLAASPAQNVGLTGRVTDAHGKPVINAYITLKNGTDIIGHARTNPFGFYRFKNIPTNKTYTLSTIAKGLSFYDRNVLVDDEIANFLIVSE